jgi:hypothetical protein
MRARVRLSIRLLAAAMLVGALAPQPIAAQAPPGGKSTPVPKTPWGHPDLQGLWNSATITPLEGPTNAEKAVLTEEEAAALERGQAERMARADRASNPDRIAPPVGGDGSQGASGNVGGYNAFWIDPGTKTIVVNGERRSSLIIDPPDGRVPPLTAEARERAAARLKAVAAPTSDAPENVVTRQRGAYDDPELRPLAERCIIGFGSVSGPPMLPVLYNNFKQIVQTPDYVMILVEMIHDARIIPLNKPHGPSHIRKWMGDSVGRWEGDTLVVETTHFNDKTRFRGSSQNMKVTERFTRVDANTLMYRFTVEDPSTWTKPWTAEYPMPHAQPGEQLYEYACHEGNYSFGGIMRGERILDEERALAAEEAKN